MEINFAALAYLNRRGYSNELILREGVREFPRGKHAHEGIEFGCADSSLAFTSRTMSGALQGLAVSSWGDQEKRYEWRPGPSPWLPICYAQPDDWARLYETGEVVLVEGIFDRAALKRCLPDRAVIARLSKSVASIEWVLKRYASCVWLAFDRDEEGEKGARRLERRVGTADCVVRRLAFYGKDPGEHFEAHGEAQLRRIVERQMERAPL